MKQKKERLYTKHLMLKAYDDADRQQMVNILLNEEIKKTFMIPDFECVKQAEELFEKLKHYSKSDDHFEYGIYLNDMLIGFVNDCGIKDSMIELGYVIHPNYQGKGYATEALHICINELFRMGFKHIRAGFFEQNIASCRVMQKCGMYKLDLEEDIQYKGNLYHSLYYGIDKND